MMIPDNVRKCVVFVALKTTDGVYHFCGSAFFLGHGANERVKTDRTYLVTARHVIDGIRGKGVEEAWVRSNKKDGTTAWSAFPLKGWFVHPNDSSIDVAIFEIGIAPELDHLVVPYSLSVDRTTIEQNKVGLGDEVLITGLFRHHHGQARNIPIVRIGNIACLEEKVTIDSGDIEAYLIEARSIGGLSGSPVFVALEPLRNVQGILAIAPKEISLLGLIHGHYDELRQSNDQTKRKSLDAINMGIAIVVPVGIIKDVIALYESTRAN